MCSVLLCACQSVCLLVIWWRFLQLVSIFPPDGLVVEQLRVFVEVTVQQSDGSSESTHVLRARQYHCSIWQEQENAGMMACLFTLSSYLSFQVSARHLKGLKVILEIFFNCRNVCRRGMMSYSNSSLLHKGCSSYHLFLHCEREEAQLNATL